MLKIASPYSPSVWALYKQEVTTIPFPGINNMYMLHAASVQHSRENSCANIITHT
jgi:hypothetical protein